MKFKNLSKKSASLLALAIGLLSIISGSRALLDVSAPDQIILHWLVVYNVVFGIASVIVGVQIWGDFRHARRMSLGIMMCHLAVLAILITIYFISAGVAVKSMGAMAFRSIIWAVIGLILLRKAK